MKLIYILFLASLLYAESDSCKTIRYNSMETVVCDTSLYDMAVQCAKYNKMSVSAYVYQAISERVEYDLEEMFFNSGVIK